MGLVVAALILSLSSFPIGLPLVPVQSLHDSIAFAVDSTLGESVGWPTYVAEIAHVYHALPVGVQAKTIVLASNYGEAGAVQHFGPQDGLPAVFSGHMSYWYWGPPPASATTAVAVGFQRSQLARVCGSLRLAAHLNNHVDLANEEQGAPVWVCGNLRTSWALAWPSFKTFG
jgi:hypothetical protein